MHHYAWVPTQHDAERNAIERRCGCGCGRMSWRDLSARPPFDLWRYGPRPEQVREADLEIHPHKTYPRGTFPELDKVADGL